MSMTVADVHNGVQADIDYLNANILRVPTSYQQAANSLVISFSQRPERFSEKQANFVRSIVSKLRAPAIKESVGSFEPVVELFEKARRKQKFPKLRLQLDDGQKVVLSVAGPNATHPGTINVTDGGSFGESTFFGRVTKDGLFEVRTERPGIKELLQKVATNPAQTAKEYGKLTGICCCCGRELTDPNSIEQGIGPICAGGWGF